MAAGLTYAYARRATRRRSQRDAQNDDGLAKRQNVATTETSRDTSAPLDDAGTTDEMAVHIIRTVRDRAFEGSDEKLALALGRPAEQIRAWLERSLAVDSDGLIKARGLADERNVDVPLEPIGASS